MTTRLKALVVAVIYSLLAWMLIVHVVATFMTSETDADREVTPSEDRRNVAPPAPPSP